MREEGLEVTAPCRVARGVPPRRVEAVVEKVWSITHSLVNVNYSCRALGQSEFSDPKGQTSQGILDQTQSEDNFICKKTPNIGSRGGVSKRCPNAKKVNLP